MAKRIQGITIELDGETKGLDKALKNVNKRSMDLQKELKDVERLLKFDPGNTEAIAQKQKLLADQVQNSTEKLDKLKQAEKQVQDQFKRGDIKEEQYRAFKREVQFTERELDGFKNKLKKLDDGKELSNLKKDMKGVKKETEKAEKSVQDLGSELGSLAGGVSAGLGAAFGVDQALSASSMNTQIDISFNIPEESKKEVKQAIKNIEAYGIDAESALEGARRQWALNADASDEANRKIIEGAAGISRAYQGIDFTELIQETNEIAEALSISDEQALGLTNSLLEMGFPPEQIDIISEYGTQLENAGYSALEIQEIMAAGVETGTWNIDNLLDGLKEGRIRLSEFGDEVPEAVGDLIEGTKISEGQLNKWGDAISEGGEGGKKAMKEVAEALNGVEDETKKNLLGVEFFGTMYEDQGQNIIDTLLNAEEGTASLRENQDKLNESVEQINQDPLVQFKQAMNDLKEAAMPLLEVIAEVITKISEWVSENPQLATTILAIATAVGTILGALMALAPIIFSIINIVKIMGTAFAAITAPVWWVIAAIAALIAIGIAVWKNWDTISQKGREIFGALGEWLSTKWQQIKTWILDFVSQMVVGAVSKFQQFRQSASEKMEQIRAKISEIWQSIKTTFTETLQNIWTAVKNKFDDIVSSIGQKMNDAWDKVEDIWDSIQGFFEGIDLFDIGADIIQGLINGMGSLASDVWAKAESIAGSIKDAAKDILGIASPSKEMKKIGVWTGEGMEQGLNAMSNRVAKAGQRMADASIPNTPQIEANAPGGATQDMSNLMQAINNLAGRDIVLNINGREFARATGPAMSQQLQSQKVNAKRRVGGR